MSAKLLFPAILAGFSGSILAADPPAKMEAKPAVPPAITAPKPAVPPLVPGAKPGTPAAAMPADPKADPPKPEKPPKPPATPAHKKDGSQKSPETAAAEADKLLMEEVLSGAKSLPVGRCDDATFLRRISLDLTGQIPSPAELKKFLAESGSEKRAKTVERLVAEKEFGQNWASYWRDVIMSRKTEDRAQIVAKTCQDYLMAEFNNNTSWDEIARSFITATGDVREEGNTAIMMAQNGNTEDVTSEVCRIFMGIQISCANCHNHPTDRWVREQFHGLAAFFPRVEVRQMMGDVRTFVVQGRDREALFRGPMRRGSTEHYMQDLKKPNDRGQRMQPVFFVTGEKISTGVSDEERRTTIAKWITAPKDEWFAKAIVNRLWSELVGEGFYEPVDDMGPDRECAAPKTLAHLAQEFVAHNHDLKWLFRTIMATDTYQRESRSRHEPGETPFTANVQQRLRADQLYSSLAKALGIAEFGGGGGLGLRGGPFRSPRAQFGTTYNYDPSVRRDEVSGSIPQALLLMNSNEISRYLSARSPGSALGRILSENRSDDSAVSALYVRTLSREPSDAELKRCLEFAKKSYSRTDAFEDILWSLVNSTEFLHRR